MNNFYVYVHKNLDTGEVFYVGKGTGDRYKAERGRTRAWFTYTDSCKWEAEIVESDLLEQAAFKKEAELIEKYGIANLTNKNKGFTSSKTPNFIRIGDGSTNKANVKSIDLLTVAMDLSKPSQFLVKLILAGINYENGYNPVVYITRKEMSKSQQNYMDAGFKDLFEKDLVRRVKPSHYMLNPRALIPLDYEEAVKVWNKSPAYVPPTPAPTPAPTVFTIDRGNI